MIETDLQAEVEKLTKRVERERRARMEAEMLAEQETRSLYDRKTELELLHRITEAANGATSVREVIQETLHAICAYTHWPVGHAYIVDEAQGALVPSGIWHLERPEKFEAFRDATESRRFTMGEGLPGSVWLSGQSLWVADLQSAPNFPRAKASADIGVVSAFAFPVMAGTKITAVLEFFTDLRTQKMDAWLKIAEQAGVQLGRIFERQRATSDIERASRELLELSRSAGMAEVATGVLHNVGNVLNSVSVSSVIIGDRLKKSKVANLRQAVAMLQEKEGSLAEFLTQDPKGRMLPAYLIKAAEQLEKDQAEMLAEAESLHENIEHIKSIVSMQQNYARVAGLPELLNPVALVDDALRMKGPTMARHQIEIVRDFVKDTPPIRADRHQVMQILINLLRNAKQAMEDIGSGKRISVRVAPHDDHHIAVTITDNGTGIAPENLTRIFNYGFTTKPAGHGFGLHSGANAAKEMGGRIEARSDGVGRGATFTLYLPVNGESEKSA